MSGARWRAAVVAVVIASAACGAGRAAAAPGASSSPASVEPGAGCLTFFGDVLLGRGVAREIERRKSSPWDALAASPRLARTWVGNFEGAVLTVAGASCPRRDGLCLGVEPQILDWLASSRFRALSIANNHIDDFGPAGHAATHAALAAHGVTPIDEHAGPTLIDVDGTRWALVSLNLAGRTATERQAALERARLQIGLARAQTGRVVVLPHWGREGKAFLAPEQELWAPLFARWGATLIAGSHAHVVQPARCDSDVAIYFGLGNHLFDQANGPNREGLAVTCCPAGAGLQCSTARTGRSVTSVYPRLTDPVDEPSVAAPVCAVTVEEPDRRWLAHPARDTLLFVQPFPTAGPDTFFSLRRHWSSFDREDALRPYVFRVERQGAPARPRIVDVWRGTALARPLVAARLFPWRGGQLLCAIHRDDTFLAPKPQSTERIRLVYRWTGFGFRGVDDEGALRECESL